MGRQPRMGTANPIQPLGCPAGCGNAAAGPWWGPGHSLQSMEPLAGCAPTKGPHLWPHQEPPAVTEGSHHSQGQGAA